MTTPHIPDRDASRAIAGPHPQDPLLAQPQALLDPFPPMALCWASLSSQEQQEAFDALDDWVDWLVERYQLDHRVVPPCWLEHTALLEELSALRTAWLEAFCITASGRDPLDWHAAFAATRQRLSDWAARTGCRPGEHRA